VVEALEALRLLSDAAPVLPGLSVERDVFSGPAVPFPADSPTTSQTDAAWDEGLTRTRLADILGPTRSASTFVASNVESGLTQLNKYLSRSWYRAGIPPQAHDDCTQAVFVSLLQTLGRDRFDLLLGDIGQSGIKDVLSRETPEGLDFFRAIDTVKKRAQREKTFQPLDSIDVAVGSDGSDSLALWRGALQDAIDESLTPREASLVYDTLMGKTPAEIAQQWGVAPKTVSNEKTRVIAKLREILTADMTN